MAVGDLHQAHPDQWSEALAGLEVVGVNVPRLASEVLQPSHRVAAQRQTSVVCFHVGLLRGLLAPRLPFRRQGGKVALRGEAPQTDLLTVGPADRADAAVLVGLATVGLVEVAEPEVPAEDSGGKINAHLRDLPGMVLQGSGQGLNRIGEAPGERST